MSLTWAPGRCHISLQGQSAQYIGPSFLLDEATYKYYLSFLSCVRKVVIHGVALSGLRYISGVGRLSSISFIDWSSSTRISYLLYRGTQESEVGKEQVCLHPKHGLTSIHFFAIHLPLYSL